MTRILPILLLLALGIVGAVLWWKKESPAPAAAETTGTPNQQAKKPIQIGGEKCPGGICPVNLGGK